MHGPVLEWLAIGAEGSMVSMPAVSYTDPGRVAAAAPISWRVASRSKWANASSTSTLCATLPNAASPPFLYLVDPMP